MADCVDKYGNCTKPSDDGLPVQCVGAWVEEKHTYIERYVEATRAVRKKYLGATRAGAAFIDLFAGPGRARIRETGKFIQGSPFIALDHNDAPFSKVILCEIAPENVAALRERTKNYEDSVDIVPGDCNATIDSVVRSMPRFGLNLALIDMAPYVNARRPSRSPDPSAPTL